MIQDIQCEHCGHAWEELLKSVSSLPTCPACGSAFTKVEYKKGPAVAGTARKRIENRAMRGGSTPRGVSQVPRSYKMPADGKKLKLTKE